MVSLEEQLTQRLAAAFLMVADVPVDPAVRRSQHADYQSDAALALSRTLGRSPREVAEQVLEHAQLDGICAKVEVSGPGFINLTVANDTLGQLLAATAADSRLGAAPSADPEVITIDYSAPNAAKEMHVGHLRSTIIGDAAVRLLEWLGHTVVRQNHVGDWGTPFGMLIEHLLDIGETEAANALSVGDLNRYYRAARRKFDTDETFKNRARRRVVLLQRGDPTTRRLWELLIGESMKYFAAVYSRLGVRLTDADYFGEKRYNDDLQPVVDELDDLGLLRISDGANCVFPKGFTSRDGEPLPLIVQKSDGGFGYAATDLATIVRRLRVLEATRLLYVVGLPQRQHLGMVFETAREAGWLVPPARAEHVGHGSILGEDGKILRTRAGASVKLVELLDEAIARATATVAEKNPALEPDERAAVAKAVGIGAVKYADLSTDRVKDYVFDLDRMLAFDGNTGPYLQYAHARIRSIFRRAGLQTSKELHRVSLTEQPERVLAIELLTFADLVRDLEKSLELHRLASYLYGLGSAFTTFYERCPVLKAEGEVRVSRLVLCDLTARTLKLGLGLLGITAPDRM